MARNRTNGSIRFHLMAGGVLKNNPPVSPHGLYSHGILAHHECVPVLRSGVLSDGSLRLTSKVGTTVVPPSFPRQRSHDHQMHICMARYSHLDNMRPVCLFVPMEDVDRLLY